MKSSGSVFVLGLLVCTTCSCSGESEIVSKVGNRESSNELKGLFLETGNIEFIQALVSRLSSSTPDEVLGSLNALSLLSAQIPTDLKMDIIEAIRPHLSSRDPAMTHSAAAATVAYGQYAYPVIEELSAIVERNDSGAAFFAAEAIGKIGFRANESQDVLVAALGVETKTRIYAIEALSKIGPLSEMNLNKIKAFLDSTNDDPYFLIGVAKVIVLNGSNEGPEKRILIENLNHHSERRRTKVLHAFEEVGLKKIEWAIPLVREVGIGDSDSNVKFYANKLLNAFEGKGE